MPLIFVLIIVIIGGIAIAVAMMSAAAERKRTESLATFAQAAGFQFSPYTPDFYERYSTFVPFDKGDERESRNLMYGMLDGHAWYCFDFRYTDITTSSKGGTQRTTYDFGVVVVRYPWTVPYLAIGPEGPFAGLASLFGVQDIQFESDEFNRAYNVQCNDKKFAYDLLHPQVMEYLLAIDIYDWQFGPMAAMIVTSGRPLPSDIAERIRALQGFLKKVPPYVLQDFGFTPKWAGPLQ